jgi:putative ABC transport system permease protein
LLALAVVLAVAALSAVGFVADRLNAGLQRDARALLGGDAVFTSDRATPAEVVAQAKAQGLQTAQTMAFPTMARAVDSAGGATKLVALKAVDTSYPLRGVLKLHAAGSTTQTEAASGTPSPGTVWVDPGLLASLNLKLGDSLLLGDSTLKIARTIAQEPDRGAGFMNFAPRVMLAWPDLAATQLVQPASRITWRLAVASANGQSAGASKAAIQGFETWAKAQIESGSLRGSRLESFEGGRPEMRQTLDRAARFLNLVALLSALLSAVAIAIAARGFAQSHLDACAMHPQHWPGLQHRVCGRGPGCQCGGPGRGLRPACRVAQRAARLG